MKLAKMKLDFAKCQMNWLGASVPLHPKEYFSNKTKLHRLLEHDSICVKIIKSYSACHTHVKDAIYSIHDPDEIAKKQLHLTTKQRDELAVVLRKCTILFSGHIGYYTKHTFHIELKLFMIPIPHQATVSYLGP
jgi:hypothetical protein